MVVCSRWLAGPLLCLIAFSVPATPAEARVNGGGDPELAANCLYLQDKFDALAQEYGGASSGRREEIIGLALTIMGDWSKYCSGTYGSILVRQHVVVCSEETPFDPTCTPIVDTLEDSDDDNMADLYERDLGLDVFDADSDDDGLPDGVDPSWIAELVLALPDGSIPVPKGSTFESTVVELAGLALAAEQDCYNGRWDMATEGLAVLKDRVSGSPAAEDDDLEFAIETIVINVGYSADFIK